MAFTRAAITLFGCLLTSAVLAAAPTTDAPLPALEISDRGELVAQDKEFSFRPWSSTNHPGKVHVIQYIGAKMSDKDLFKPLTDALETRFEPGSVHVTTVLNMDAAMWGTSGLVMSELKKNKLKYPEATMVIDEEGTGVDIWGLKESGRGLFVTTSDGTVKYFASQSLSEEELASTIELIRANIGN
ncbi:MAG: hypothetical protein KDI09_18905 [Halioglobus sp.]|nr:hypothetical protein [Halioglobus sp.]